MKLCVFTKFAMINQAARLIFGLNEKNMKSLHCLAEGFFVHAFVMFTVIHITCKCKTNIKKAQLNFFRLRVNFKSNH